MALTLEQQAKANSMTQQLLGAKTTLTNLQQKQTTAPIPVADITGTPPTPINVPPQTPLTGIDALGAYIKSQSEQSAKALQDQATAGQSQLNDLGTQIRGLLEAPGETAATADAYKTGGVDTAQAELTDINQQIIAEQVALNHQIQAIEKNPEGMSTRGIQAEVNRVKGESLFRQADMSVIALAKQGKFDSAKTIADRAVAALTESRQNKLNSLQFLYGEVKDTLSKQQDRAFQVAFQGRKDELDFIKQQYMAKFNQTIDQEQAKFQQDIDKENAAYEQSLRLQGYGIAGGSGAPIVDAKGTQLEFGTPEYIIERLRQTSGSKTKPVASEREHLGKFANVVALTDNLMNSLNKTTNDPILGYLRSLNPYDFDARAVNAQVTALVPSVARALYGEVGVLTDTDIERYLKTLPNIRSTEDQNKFIAMMTLGNARRAYEQTLLNLASSNVNVSGFVDSYKNLSDRLNTLEKGFGTEAAVDSYTPYQNTESTDLQFSGTSGGETDGVFKKTLNWAKWLIGF